MKFRDYTYQTGNCVINDTDAVFINSQVREIIESLIEAMIGKLPSPFGDLTYLFTEINSMGMLSVIYQGNTLWTSLFLSSQESLVELKKVTDLFIQAGVITQKNHEYKTPCIVTIIAPGAIKVPTPVIHFCGGIPKDFAGAWFDLKFKKKSKAS